MFNFINKSIYKVRRKTDEKKSIGNGIDTCIDFGHGWMWRERDF